VKSGSSYHGKKKGVKAFGPDPAALTDRRRAGYSGRNGPVHRPACSQNGALRDIVRQRPKGAGMQNRIVVRYQDGRLLKGTTTDFLPTKDVFHVVIAGDPSAKPTEVRVGNLKAVFFVKDFSGNAEYAERRTFESSKPAMGRKIQVVFKDGEVLTGTTQGYQPGRAGFFVFPADANSNNDRCFVVSAAVKDVTFV
jgi:small nuclear ribonucleoprotein (snRNP)-like protein